MESTATRPFTVEKMLERMETPWNQTAKMPDRKLLRIALMREMSRTLHTLRSECLATGQDGQARDLLLREEFLSHRFMELQTQDLPLRQVYARSASGRLESRGPDAMPALPPELTAVIDGSKFTRPDRHWEAFLAIEAFARGWSFWTFECWVEIENVESWAKEFSDSLWPRGVVLFIESSGFHRGPQSLWRGKWFLVITSDIARDIAPEIGNADLSALLGIDTDQLPRVPQESPERIGPHWNRLR
jgi:hypothetical protein